MRASVLPRSRVADPAGLRIAICLVGLTGAVALRVAVSGADGAASLRGGLVFAAVLLLLSCTFGGTSPHIGTRRQKLLYGVGGAVVLVLPALLLHLGRPLAAASGYAPWAAVVVCVAVAEELLLRGALFAAVSERFGTVAAVAVGAVAFAAVHVPLYGASVVWLDLAVGVWLGVLRVVSGSVAAPAAAHALADLAGWFVR